MIEQQTVKTVSLEKNIWEYTAKELKAILGNFEREYHEATTGNPVHNEILGNVHEGNIEHALRIGAITEKDGCYFIRLPEYRDYDLKIRVLGELYKKRDYARKVNNPLGGMKKDIFK